MVAAAAGCWRCRSALGALAAGVLRGFTKRRVFPDRAGDLARPRRENAILMSSTPCEAQRGPVHRRGGAGSSAAAIPSDPDDIALAFIFGVLPLAISAGAGAGARRSVGTGVMGWNDGGDVSLRSFSCLYSSAYHRPQLSERRTASELRTEIELERERAHPPIDVPHPWR